MSITPNEINRVQIKPWDESDWPIAWLWIDAHWHDLADDFHPRDLESFVEFKRREGAEAFGVYRGDELGGLIVYVPRSPVVCSGHVVSSARL